MCQCNVCTVRVVKKIFHTFNFCAKKNQVPTVQGWNAQTAILLPIEKWHYQGQWRLSTRQNRPQPYQFQQLLFGLLQLQFWKKEVNTTNNIKQTIFLTSSTGKKIFFKTFLSIATFFSSDEDKTLQCKIKKNNLLL